MVFHEIDSITDILNGHRVIIYYIAAVEHTGSKTNLFSVIEVVLEMLEKKNDDLLIVKVVYPSAMYAKFQDIYQFSHTGSATFFVVNNEGIPLMYEQIDQEGMIVNALETLSAKCKLNSITKIDISKISLSMSETVDIPIKTSTSLTANGHNELLTNRPSGVYKTGGAPTGEKQVVKDTCSSVTPAVNDKMLEAQQPSNTRLQIRLPNGNRHQENFDKKTMLQEVWILIRTKFDIKDFDLKTYNHHVFSEVEYEMSLQDLDLYPSGVLIVVLKNIAPFRPGAGVVGVIQYNVQQMWRKTGSLLYYIHGILVMYWNSFWNTDDRQGRRQPQSLNGNREERSQPARSGAKATSSNIHTLRRNNDSDDENNRYNGNSTQQK